VPGSAEKIKCEPSREQKKQAGKINLEKISAQSARLKSPSTKLARDFQPTLRVHLRQT
jgi:hypothetical protein